MDNMEYSAEGYSTFSPVLTLGPSTCLASCKTLGVDGGAFDLVEESVTETLKENLEVLEELECCDHP